MNSNNVFDRSDGIFFFSTFLIIIIEFPKGVVLSNQNGWAGTSGQIMGEKGK